MHALLKARIQSMCLFYLWLERAFLLFKTMGFLVKAWVQLVRLKLELKLVVDE
jgi:hypothetical protein